jgi:hypothetical protein
MVTYKTRDGIKQKKNGRGQPRRISSVQRQGKENVKKKEKGVKKVLLRVFESRRKDG